MNFSVGYQFDENGYFLNSIMQYKDKIEEIYFAMPDIANGRGNSWMKTLNFKEAIFRQEDELTLLKGMGFKMNLLLNAMCYGENSLSRVFFNKLGDSIDYATQVFGVSSVTTTSPIIAKFIKNNFSDVTVRASVNMEIGSIEGMEYIAENFDGFYMKRELNRNFAKIEELQNWCNNNQKQLFMLANSGCLNNCSAHAFHDNLVSHENDIMKMDNAYAFDGVCKKFLSKEENKLKFLDYTNFIRPEDLHHYEKYFKCVKLATRVHDAPDRIIRAYCGGKWSGSLPELLEPNHSGAISPYIIDNSKVNSQITNNVLLYSGMDKALTKINN